MPEKLVIITSVDEAMDYKEDIFDLSGVEILDGVTDARINFLNKEIVAWGIDQEKFLFKSSNGKRLVFTKEYYFGYTLLWQKKSYESLKD